VTEPCFEFVSRDKVTELRVEFVSRDRLSETYVVVNDQSQATWNARQRIKPSSILPRDPKTSSGALQELNKAPTFWRYQFLQRASPLDKPNSNPPGQVTFWRTHAATRNSATAHKDAQHLQCNTLAWLHCKAEPSRFYLRELTKGGRLPEREPSQLVLDQVLNQSCKISSIYTQFQPIMLQFWLTHIRCLGDGYESEHDWCILSLDISGLVCFVMLVYQSRLSVDPVGHFYLRRSLQFLLFEFPWLISPDV